MSLDGGSCRCDDDVVILAGDPLDGLPCPRAAAASATIVRYVVRVVTAQLATDIRSLVRLPRSTYARAVGYAVVVALLIGIPSDLVDNPIFGRPVPVRAIDYPIWIVTSLLIGLTLAIRPDSEGSLGQVERTDDAPLDGEGPAEVVDDTRPLWAGFVSFLAVGCPVCNQVVVLALGTSGALSWWAPVQPFVGLAAIGLAGWALHRRLATYDLKACPIPGAADRIGA